MPVQPLDARSLWRSCDPEQFDFATTAQLEDIQEVVGQERATDAVRFGMGIRKPGFHIFALGPEEADMQRVVRRFLEERAAGEPVPPDICYVDNFEESHRPTALILPAGKGSELAQDVNRVLEELRAGLEAAFESEEYQARRRGIEEEAGEEHEQALSELSDKAKAQGLALMRTPVGFAFAPVRDGDVLSSEELSQLSEEATEALQARIERLEEELQQVLHQIPRRQREVRDRVRELNREVAEFAVRDLLDELRSKYERFPAVLQHLDRVQRHMVENVRQLVRPEPQVPPEMAALMEGAGRAPDLRRYRVNVLVDHAESATAPVVHEENPTHPNLIGRVEYQPLLGALVTDFTMLKPGALHRANGGYLLLDARQVLLQPFAWEGLKRVLSSGELRTESPRDALGLVSTVSLEPEPVPLNVKVVLLGDRLLYYLLSELEPDVPRLFKVAADFADEMDRTLEGEQLYARLIATLASQDELRPLDRDAVARVIERSARLAGDAEKLSVHTRGVLDLLREADYWAGEEEAATISAGHVQTAIDQWTYRSDRIRERTQEEILRETIYIDTDGSVVGQVNGLSVLTIGGFSFGRPSRITARIQLGSGKVLDIEREVELSGPIHSKGVLILAGFLGGRYARESPLSLAASLVFEQSYSGVEGDSASSTELYALLSAIAEVPLAQGMAVTGSVNQHGAVQPIGGVNEKIEGFFDICAARGLTGEQGVIIPASNVKHLMLEARVRDAVAEGKFHVWPVRTIDEGMEILTGLPMGEADASGTYPEGSVNRLVVDRLAALAEVRREFAGEAGAEGGGGPENNDD
ncbi:MAG: AAA family ATPase [Gemmatimonadota bacterium]|nr:MAG: AAA family ATPase [Gemmatimonadota bacterium]